MDDCIEWEGARNQKGYGHKMVDGRLKRVHRLAWEQANGPIPDGMIVMHTCDNPPCINLNHLVLGTHADNMRDRATKGHTAKGESHGDSKLTEADVLAIRARRAAGERNIDLAREYHVSRPTISNIVQRHSWRHLPVNPQPRKEEGHESS